MRNYRSAPWLVILFIVLAAGALADDLLVSSRFTDQVLRYDATGNSLGVFASGGGLDNPVGITFGPDGHLYVASGDTNQVLRYEGQTGQFLGVAASGGGLSGTRHVNFGPDGFLYVASGSNNRILRYDPVTGAFLGTFASGGGLAGPTSFTFGPDKNLYVVSVLNHRVLRYDGQTGAFDQIFAQTSLTNPHDVVFGPEGDLYVVNANGPNKVVRFGGVNGALVGVFVTDAGLVNPLGAKWGTDGDLYIANQGGDDVRRYDGRTGQLKSIVVPSGAGGLDGSMFLLTVPTAPGLEQLAPTPPGFGHPVHLVARGAAPGSCVVTLVGLVAANLPYCPGAALGIQSPLILFTGVADESGDFVRSVTVPAAVAGFTLLFQAIMVSGCASSAVVSHTF